MKKLLKLRAIQTLKGDDAVTQEILRALRKTKGDMRKACDALEIGKSSMYRLIQDLGPAAGAKIEELVQELKGRSGEPDTDTPAPKPEPRREPPASTPAPRGGGPRLRTKKAAA